MKIGLISDTHGYLDKKVFSYFKLCDEVWHAGDVGDVNIVKELKRFKPLKAVYGNIDGFAVRQESPENLFFSCGGMKVLLTHIAGKPPSFNPRIQALCEKYKPDILACGHSHILRVSKHGNLVYLNPGAAGYYGIHKMRTLLRFDVKDGGLMNMEVIELGPSRMYGNL